MPTVAIVTCAELPDLDPDEIRLITPLAERGITVVPTVWDDPAVNWNAFDAIVIRSTWDYQDHRQRFLEWARSVPRLHNPAAVLEWNTDKRYLAELSEAGVPVVPTTWLPPASPDAMLPQRGEWVIKPSIGAGSREAGRYLLDSEEHRKLAADHVARLHRSGATVMAQPYLPDVDTNGERALMYIAGHYSHAVRKSAMLTGPYDGDVELYKQERITAAEATADERRLGDAVMAVVAERFPQDLLYARVDVVTHDDDLLLLELELAEPSLFYGYGPNAAEAMAEAIAALV
jgi:glutathione synthase/RimK-type ligase-like ATP-grasp enzyme